jgi:hypothetical protein
MDEADVAAREDVVSIAGRAATLTRTTPGLYRAASIVIAFLLVVTAVVATIAANSAENATNRLRENTAPVLVATQSLLASLAEADAAATAAFLSGANEDREQRRLYEEALARASAQAEEISALIGDDESAHNSLKLLSIRVNRYAGLIEAARATLRAGAPESDDYLLRALDEVAAAVSTDAANLTEASERRFDRDAGARTPLVVITAVVALLALVAIVGASVVMTRRSRRLINPFMVLAALATIGGAGWLVASDVRAGNDIDEARDDAYESIALTAQIQTAGFGARTSESIALIAGDAAARQEADEAGRRLTTIDVDATVADLVRGGEADPSAEGLFFTAAREADSPRERAAVAEAMVRWQRYTDTVDQLRSASAEAARAIAVGPASATFNGFNFSVESVLAENRSQFLEAIARADDRTSALSTITLVLPLLAAAAALAGLQIRINEYR